MPRARRRGKRRKSRRKLKRQARQRAKQLAISKADLHVDPELKPLLGNLQEVQKRVSTARRMVYLAMHLICAEYLEQQASLPLHGKLVRLHDPVLWPFFTCS